MCLSLELTVFNELTQREREGRGRREKRGEKGEKGEKEGIEGERRGRGVET